MANSFVEGDLLVGGRFLLRAARRLLLRFEAGSGGVVDAFIVSIYGWMQWMNAIEDVRLRKVLAFQSGNPLRRRLVTTTQRLSEDKLLTSTGRGLSLTVLFSLCWDI